MFNSQSTAVEKVLETVATHPKLMDIHKMISDIVCASLHDSVFSFRSFFFFLSLSKKNSLDTVSKD